MQAVTTIGLDIAKSVFQIHGIEAAGNVIVRRRLKRRYVLPFFQAWILRIVGASTAPTSMALPCRWRSRPQHQKRTYAVQQMFSPQFLP